MALFSQDSVILQLSLLVHIFIGVAAEGRSVLDIVPSSYLLGLTGSVHMTCRPPATEDVAQVLTLQVNKQRDNATGHDSVATYVTSGFPLVAKPLGVLLNAAVSGSYDNANPHAAFLSVALPQPTDLADGRYKCRVETLDSHGVLHMYLSTSQDGTLTSLSKNGSVPAFYHSVLKDMRNDLDTLTSDLHTVTNAQLALTSTDNQAQARLSALVTEAGKISGSISDAMSYTNDANTRVTSMRSELVRLRDVTPATRVNFYAYLSSHYVNMGNKVNIVFNAVEQHTDDAYSKTTGVFTTPVNGTYLMKTGVTGDSASFSASIVVNDQPVASLIGNDDYNIQQATACVVMKLNAGNTVRVVKWSGSNIYGYNPNSASNNHVTYFMGLLLW